MAWSSDPRTRRRQMAAANRTRNLNQDYADYLRAEENVQEIQNHRRDYDDYSRYSQDLERAEFKRLQLQQAIPAKDFKRLELED